jgi:hypothetical protein
MKYPIFELTPDKFVQLCSDLFQAEYVYDKLYIFTNNNGKTVDIQGHKGIEKIGIEVKHKSTFSEKSLVELIENFKNQFDVYHQFFFIISAKISKQDKLKFSTENVKILDQEDLFKLLDKHNDVAKRYFQNLKVEKKKTSFVFTSSLVAVIASIAVSSTTIFSFFEKNESKPLENKIQNVEQVLNGIKNLEGDLNKIKEDMVETEIQNKKIMLEYEKLKGVEDLIEKRKEELNSIVNYKSWSTRIFEFLFGTFFGVVTSIFSSILYDKWKQKRALKE